MANRAPNRDLVDRYEGRDGDGVRRQYFRHHNPIERWKWRLTGVALAAGLAWLLAGPVGRLVGWHGGSYRLTHGPVTSVHAAWDANCEACHRGVGDKDSHASLNPFAVGGRWLDLSCGHCHASPAHSSNLNDRAAATDANCAGCHHDHNGRNFSLVRLTDNHCDQCHAGLGEWAKGTPGFQNVGDWAGHPEFRELRDEKAGKPHERTIRFSHAQHMAAGMAATDNPAADRGAKRLRDLSPDDAKRYRRAGQADDAPVQLECASCHQLDAGRVGADGAMPLAAAVAGLPREAVQPPRAAGAYYLPINFDAHCKACHPIEITVDVSGAKAKGTAFTNLPHRKQPKEFADVLRGEFARRLLTDDPDVAGRPAFARLNPAAGDARDEGVPKARQAIDDAVTKATGLMFGRGGSAGTCGKCHDMEGTGDARRVKHVRIPTVWFEHAKFDHMSHRGAGCAECHPTAYATADRLALVRENKPGFDREPVNILGVESCKVCHGPPHTADVGGQRVAAGGVRAGCTDCHRYHNGDNPLQGRGAAARDPQPAMTVADFLRGRPKE